MTSRAAASIQQEEGSTGCDDFRHVEVPPYTAYSIYHISLGGRTTRFESACRQDEAPQLVTNFEAAAPASYFAELYKTDQLYGGHVIMLGADPESK